MNSRTKYHNVTPVDVPSKTNLTASNVSFDRDSTATDAFGRLRISEPFSLFEYSAANEFHNELFWSSKITNSGSATVLTASAEVVLSISGTVGDKVEYQTKINQHYQPGKSFLIFTTFNLSGSDTNVVKRVGYFDSDDGIFLQLSGSYLGLVKRTSINSTNGGVDTFVSQSAWNIDKLDGTGVSGINLDVTKVQLFSIDLEWLGVGRVRCGFLNKGKIHPCHEFTHANSNVDVYMRSATLPIRGEIEALGASSVSNFRGFCTTVISEGGYSPQTLHRSVNRAASAASVGNTLRPVLSIRLQSKEKLNTIIPFAVAILSDGATSNFYWQIMLNPVITGGTAASWTAVSGSVVEYDIAQTGAASNGYVLYSGYGVNSTSTSFLLDTAVRLGQDLNNNKDILSLCVYKFGAGSDNFYASLDWEEYI